MVAKNQQPRGRQNYPGHLDYRQSILYGTGPLDPAVFLTVIAILLLVAAIACLIPAWRASRLDPMGALRTE